MILSAGGSWDIGSGSFLLYNPDADISLVEDVIVVTVNYRLNVFGFLASTALRNQVCPGVVRHCSLYISLMVGVIGWKPGSRWLNGKLWSPGAICSADSFIP
ncbi:MAG: carboxylesterase family protein [bacterium]